MSLTSNCVDTQYMVVVLLHSCWKFREKTRPTNCPRPFAFLLGRLDVLPFYAQFSVILFAHKTFRGRKTILPNVMFVGCRTTRCFFWRNGTLLGRLNMCPEEDFVRKLRPNPRRFNSLSFRFLPPPSFIHLQRVLRCRHCRPCLYNKHLSALENILHSAPSTFDLFLISKISM